LSIAIIGAGPAGAMAAVRLAQAGAPVMLFDPSHPREKPCGGGITGRALALVADILDIGSLPSIAVRTAIVEPPTLFSGEPSFEPAAEVPLARGDAAPERSLVVLSRAVFDGALVAAAVRAGARLIPERALDIARRGARFALRTDRQEYDIDLVIGADGVSSLVRKKLATPFSRAELSIAAGYFVHGATSSAIFIQSMRAQPGYLWSFPRPDHLAVGICAPAAQRATSPELRAQSRRWIEQHGLDRGARLEPYAWPIPTLGSPDARGMTFGGPGWMLTGDAAGLVDPLTREGIYYALLSGQWAADALGGGPAVRAATLYADRLRSEVVPEITRAAHLSGWFFSPGFSSLLVRALTDSAAVREVFVDLVTGAQPYRGLRRRLLATCEWRLAWRAIRMIVPGFTGTMTSVALPKVP
jgi:geranylgeranyl reductase family protein